MISINKDTVVDVYRDSIPTGPFLAIVGTSHTCGDCDNGTVQDTYGKLLAQQLGLDYLNLGYSGASNDDLLEITLTAIESGLLQNCKLLLIEGRLGSAFKYISRVPAIAATDETFRRSNFNSSNIVDTQQFKDTAYVNPKTSDLHYFMGNADVTRVKLADALKVRVEDKITTSSHTITKLLDYIRSKIYYESHTPMDVYNDMLKLHAMCNLGKLSGIETYWFNVSGHPVKASFIDSLYSYSILYKDNTEFEHDEYFVNSRTHLNLQSLMMNKHGLDNFNNNLCECMHGNQKMHHWMADIILEKLNATRNN